ncbi:Hypothetical protein ACI5QM_02600 [Bacillus subtilis]
MDAKSVNGSGCYVKTRGKEGKDFFGDEVTPVDDYVIDCGTLILRENLIVT